MPCFFAFGKRCENDLCRAVPISKMCLQASGYSEPADRAVQCYQAMPALAHLGFSAMWTLGERFMPRLQIVITPDYWVLSCWIHQVDKRRKFCSICTLKVILPHRYTQKNRDLYSISAEWCTVYQYHNLGYFVLANLACVLEYLAINLNVVTVLNQCPEWSCCY